MNRAPEPHSLEDVEQQVKRMPMTVGLLVLAILAVLFIIGNTTYVLNWVGGIRDDAAKNILAVDRKLDALIAQTAADRATVQNQIEAGKTQRELSMRNRDLQLDAIKAEQDRQGKRQDGFEVIVSDLSRKTERILVVVESLKEQQDKGRTAAAH